MKKRETNALKCEVIPLYNTRSTTRAALKVEEVKEDGILFHCEMNAISIKQEDTNVKIGDIEISDLVTQDIVEDLQTDEASLEKSRLNRNSDTEKPTTQVDCQCCRMTFASARLQAAHIHQLPIPNPKNGKVSCGVCDSTFLKLTTFKRHLQTKHKMCLAYRSISSNLDVVPNANDPNFFCKPCEYAYENSVQYKNHLGKRHKIQIPYLNSRQDRQDLALKPRRSSRPNPTDPNFHCKSCNVKYKNLGLYQDHLRTLHEMKVPQSRSINLKSDVEPDPNDPNFFCQGCDSKYKSRALFREHLRKTHKMILPSLMTKANPDIKPDIDDPNFYCKSCDYKYMYKSVYRNHLRIIHGITLPPLKKKANPDIEPDPNDPNFYCKSCDYKYKHQMAFHNHINYAHTRKSLHSSSKSSLGNLNKPNLFYCELCSLRNSFYTLENYHIHLMRMHNMEPTSIKKKKRSRSANTKGPDPNDPNFSCKPCNLKYPNRGRYREHLQLIHKIDLSYLKTKITNADDEPDSDDPNFSCKTCNYKFRDLAGYRFHLRNLHNMVIPYMLAKPNFAIEPDSDDPNFYCKSCSSTYSSRSRYREHLRYTHKMTLPSLKTKRDHSVEPDPNEPNFYCKSCFRNYGTLAKYRQHLRNIHKMTLLPVTRTTKKQKCESTITKNDA